jgi:hypothetical protein
LVLLIALPLLLLSFKALRLTLLGDDGAIVARLGVLANDEGGGGIDGGAGDDDDNGGSPSNEEYAVDDMLSSATKQTK